MPLASTVSGEVLHYPPSKEMITNLTESRHASTTSETRQGNRRSCIPSSYILSFAKFKKLHDQKYCTSIITCCLHLQRREHNLLNDDRLFRSRRRSKSGLENKSGSYLSQKSWKGSGQTLLRKPVGVADD